MWSSLDVPWFRSCVAPKAPLGNQHISNSFYHSSIQSQLLEQLLWLFCFSVKMLVFSHYFAFQKFLDTIWTMALLLFLVYSIFSPRQDNQSDNFPEYHMAKGFFVIWKASLILGTISDFRFYIISQLFRPWIRKFSDSVEAKMLLQGWIRNL